MNSVGFYGKLAGRGDFVSRGLPHTLVETWAGGGGRRLGGRQGQQGRARGAPQTTQ
ncbi:DUF2094 domain-containing protein, partial [Pseudomonas aeruginosa]|nr:DUF2094 domain-containing protein [Pseudomonas aeruginosa]